MEPKDFFPSYIDVSKPTLISDIYHRKEFSDLKLEPQEKTPKVGSGKLLLSQQLLNRIISPYTGYNSCLINHKMGTGKTCGVIAIAESSISYLDRLHQSLKTANPEIREIFPKKRILYLVKSNEVATNVVQELTENCTIGKYIPQNIEELTQRTLKGRKKKLYSKNYEILTFGTFAREIQKKINNKEFIEQYSNRLIIVDEAHNLRPTADDEIYNDFDDVVRKNGLDIKRLLRKGDKNQITKYLKGNIILSLYESIKKLSESSQKKIDPVSLIEPYIKKKHPKLFLKKEKKSRKSGKKEKKENREKSNFYSNIVIKALKKAFKTGKPPHDVLNMYGRFNTFFHTISKPRILLLTGTPMVDEPNEITTLMNLILPRDGQLAKNASFEKIANAVRGRVSYLREMITDVPRIDIGVAGKKHYTKYLKLKELKMSEFQYKSYKKIERKEKSPGDISEKNEDVAWRLSRQAINFIFPDGSSGKSGFEKTMKNKKEFHSKVKKLENLKKYSAKLAFIVKKLQKSVGKKQCSFVFSQDVTGGGINLIGEVLRAYGWEEAGKNVIKPGKQPRFAILTGQTKPRYSERILAIFNSKENWDGSLIRAIIGSEKVSEALTLKNISNVFLFTPLWNNSRLEQTIYRTIRINSHEFIKRGRKGKKNIRVKIYRLATLTPKGKGTIDTYMYKTSEKKDIKISRIDRILKENSIDCQITKGRNLLPTDIDYSQTCNYEICDYKCNTESVKGNNYETYIIYYSMKLQKRIIKYIQKRLSFEHIVSIDDVMNHYKDSNPKVIYLAIARYITERNTFVDIDGFEYLQRLSGNNIVLTPLNQYSQTDTSGVFYSFNPIIHRGLYADDIISYQEEKFDMRILRSIHKSQDVSFKELGRLSNQTKARIIEKGLKILLEKSSGKKGIKKLWKKLEKKDSKLFTVMNYFVQKEILDLDTLEYKLGDTINKFEEGSFKPEKLSDDRKTRKAANKEIKIPRKLQKEILFGYVAPNKTNPRTLYVVDHTDEKVARTDERASSGRVCTFLTKIKIINLLYHLGVKPPGPIEVDQRTAKELAKEIESKSRIPKNSLTGEAGESAIMGPNRKGAELVGDKPNRKLVKGNRVLKVYDTYTRKHLLYILSFANMQKTQLCKLLEKSFAKKKLLAKF